MTTYRRFLSSALFALFATIAICQSAEAQWRGRYVRRDGLFHVERLHWGGGITANGASVLNTGITAFAPVVGGLIGREAPLEDEEKERDTPRSSLGDEYLEEQRKA